MRSPSILRAYLYALYHSKKFEDLFRIMSENHFDSRYHDELKELWYFKLSIYIIFRYESRYAEDQMRKHKQLGPVDKYRIRKKFPPPLSIWDGDEVIYSFKEPSRKVIWSIEFANLIF